MPQSLPSEIVELVAERFRVLAEPARLRILGVLMDGERSVTELVQETGLNQANVSKHLGVLRASNFVERRKEGLYAIYSLADPSVAVLCEVVCGRLEVDAEEQSALLSTES